MISIDDFEPSDASDDNGEPQSVLDLIIPVSDNVDLSQVISELKMLLSHESECKERWDDIELVQMQTELHDQATSISQLREEYFKRRKVLAASLRVFTADILTDSCTLDEDSIRQRMKEVIEMFKKDFDFLAGACKNTETAYLSVYKLLRDAPNPSQTFDRTGATIEHTIQSLQKAERYITKLAKSLKDKEAECAKGRLVDQDDMILTDDMFQTKLKANLVEIKAKYEQEMSHREQSIRDSLERSKFEAQERYESLLARRESALESAHERLLRLEQQTESAIDERVLQDEKEKRRDVEDRLRALTIEHEAALSNYSHELEEMKCAMEVLQVRVQKEVSSRESIISSHLDEVQGLQREITALQNELKRYPPLDLSQLLDTLGLYDPSMRNEENCGGNGEDEGINWQTTERVIVQTVRRANADAAELRSKYSDQLKVSSATSAEANALREEVAVKNKSIQALEVQLSEAFSSIEASKALLRCHKIENASRPVTSSGIAKALSPAEEANASSLTALLNEPTHDHSSVYATTRTTAPVSGVEIGGGASSGNGYHSSRDEEAMLRAVLEQRDRMMRSVSEREQEVAMLHSQLDRVKEEKSVLHRDNLELYKRLRLLRVGTAVSGGSDMSSSSSTDRHRNVGGKGTVSGSRLSKRKGDDGDGSMGLGNEDDLEGRYATHYESQLDPFHLQELDRQFVLSRMNVCERSLAGCMRMMLQDQWMRHAFLVYLLLVHVFAIAYVVRVLNPELDSEIGAIESHWVTDGSGSIAGLDPNSNGGEWEIHPDNE